MALTRGAPLHAPHLQRYLRSSLRQLVRSSWIRCRGYQDAYTGCKAEATIPTIYNQVFSTVDPTNSGETSVNSLSRVLSTSGLPASTVNKVRELHSVVVGARVTESTAPEDYQPSKLTAAGIQTRVLCRIVSRGVGTVRKGCVAYLRR